jgi:hypothetical protein
MKKVFMASLALTLFALSITLFQMTSCKKSNAQTNCPTPTYPVTGLWEGTYQTDQVSHAPTYASLVIYPDGTIIKRNKVVGAANDYALTRGIWKLTGTVFEYRDTTLIYSGGVSVIEKGTLTFSNTGTLTSGTWQDISGQSYTGTFQNVKRIN